MRPASGGLRRHHRLPVEAKAVVWFEDETGARLWVTGVCRDLSDQGAGLVLHEPVPARSLVGVEIPELGLKATATVRYCRRGPKGYYTGVEVTAGAGWRKPVEE